MLPGFNLLMADMFGARNIAGKLSDAEINAWSSRYATITDWWEWFTGDVLAVEDRNQPAKDGKYPLKYPLKINPVATAARLHAYALWGQVADTSGALVKTVLEPKQETDRAVIAEAEEALRQVEYENSARSQMLDMGLASQCLGGTVLKVAWDPTDPFLTGGVRYEYYDPRAFHCRWSGNQYQNLDRAWIMLTITREQAEEYGVSPKTDKPTYLDYWSRDYHWLKIDGQFARDRLGNEINGPHGWGFVPFIYIPHERANDFWGTPLHKDVVGQIEELNSRWADIGDAILTGAHDELFGRNIRPGHPTSKTLGTIVKYWDLGKSLAQEPQPEMFRAGSPALPEGTLTFTSGLLENIRISMFTPEIAYGKEEGSQRSGQTLYNRMWPLLSHVLQERVHWSDGLRLRAEMTLMILALEKKLGITDKHLGLRKHHDWAPMVPIDRAQLVEELVRRRQEDAISVELMVEKFGDAPDAKEEVARILALEERAAKLAAASRPQPAENNDGGSEQRSQADAGGSAGQRSDE